MLYRHGGVWFGDGSGCRDASPLPRFDAAEDRAGGARGRDLLSVRPSGRGRRWRIRPAARHCSTSTASDRRSGTKTGFLMRRVLFATVLLLAPARAIADGACHVVDVKFQPNTSDLQIVAWIADAAGNYVDTVFITNE